MFQNLTKALLGTVTLPVAAFADLVTLGGLLAERPHTYTGDCAGAILDNLKKATEPDA